MMSRRQYFTPASLCFALAIVTWVSLSNCKPSGAGGEPRIEISHFPSAADGTPEELEDIEGRVTGALPGDRVVLFALSGVWWVQPLENRPFTAIQPDSRWKNSTHPGSAYAALLVNANYRPPLTVNALPEKGGPVRAIAVVKGAMPSSPPLTIQFSGYQWEIRQTASDQRGARNFYVPTNASVDRNGLLHLRVSKEEDHWVSAELKLSRSLGFGSYRFVVHDVSHLEPAAILAFFTWDELGPPREMDIEISRWGEPEDKNAQFVIQPYVVPANTVRFNAPAGILTYLMNWQPGRVSFKTMRGSKSNDDSDVVAEHVFTSGVPSAGNERIHMNLYVYGNNRHPLQHEFEVIIEKFEFLP
jgi:hypothetical protein